MSVKWQRAGKTVIVGGFFSVRCGEITEIDVKWCSPFSAFVALWLSVSSSPCRRLHVTLFAPLIWFYSFICFLWVVVQHNEPLLVVYILPSAVTPPRVLSDQFTMDLLIPTAGREIQIWGLLGHDDKRKWSGRVKCLQRLAVFQSNFSVFNLVPLQHKERDT